MPGAACSELDVDFVFGGLDADLLVGGQVVNDEGAEDVDGDLVEVKVAELERHRDGDVDVDGDAAAVLALLERLLQAGTVGVPALHHDVHHRLVPVALVEARQLAGAQRRLLPPFTPTRNK